MCGIAGCVDFSGRPVSADLVGRMTSVVAHRGPDREKVWVQSNAASAVGLGHRRLSVLDLSDCAAQPMLNDACVAAGRATPLTLVFNGEIYNFVELRKELIARGHRFTSMSDSEVILHLYEEKGPDCVDALRGMFAFAIWDDEQQRLVGARDRVGKKPFYFRHDGSRFWFASEAKSILVDPLVPARVSAPALQAYLRLGYVPGPCSAFEGLRRLLPGHRLVVDRSGLIEDRYWSLEYEPKLSISEVEATVELRRLLQEAVRIRLVSDVPLGAFLSGGIDSSAVVAMMCREEARVSTFAIGFEDQAYDELSYARQVAQIYRTEHHEFVVNPAAADVAEKLAWHYGEPYADSSAVPTYYLARLARQHITVALTGDGGDESFGGYARYLASRAAGQYGRLPVALRGAVGRASGSLRVGSSKSVMHRVQRFLSTGAMEPTARYAAWFGFFQGYEHLLNPACAEIAGSADPLESLTEQFARRSSLDPAERAMAVDVATYLPDDLLVKVDIATMAHGLEARSPLLDHQLMEFVARLPVQFKIRGAVKKRLLKSALRGLVPDAVLDRRKMGFGVPLDRWFRGRLGDVARDLLVAPGSRTGVYFREGTARRLLDEHVSARATHSHRLWAMFMLELWHRTCLERAGQGHTATVTALSTP